MTTLASALPETILSRCEEIKFRTGSLDKISKNFIKKESIDILKQPLNDAFKFIEKITKKEDDEILALLDSWLFWFRDLLLKDKKTKYSQEQLVKIIREIQRAKDLISNTNTNQRLALENLVLEIYV
jgi:DNA polymerase III gamma/tau subunit